MGVTGPTLQTERQILACGARFVIGCDEVGRGAIAGPVAVGLTVIDVSCAAVPEGVRDSKTVSEKRREQLEPLARRWAMHSQVGLASADEVDRLGIIAALGLAGRRAVESIAAAGIDPADGMILLDGQHDWLTPALPMSASVRTIVKADRDCASVAAASIIAKVHRDRIMIGAHDRWPVYQWAGNKGYGSAGHLAAIAAHGPTDLHRLSWLRQLRQPTEAPSA